jgi:hypothetical protein
MVIALRATMHEHTPWTILRAGTFDGKHLRKHLTVVCSLWKWGDREPVTGPEACHLEVGRLIIPNDSPPPGKPAEFLDVMEMANEKLSILEGDGDDRVMQQFTILEYEVLPDTDTR